MAALRRTGPGSVLPDAYRRGLGELVLSTAVSADGARVAAGNDRGEAFVWDAGSGVEVARLTHGDIANAVALSPDGTLWATGSDDGMVRVLDVGNGIEVAHLEHPGLINDIRFSRARNPRGHRRT